jgi:hypothetical protein
MKLPRYALIEHHHQGGHYGEEHWRTSSMDERADGDFVKWADAEALTQSSGWQPIETAPKDGTNVANRRVLLGRAVSG